jgi:hypothetical protein
MGGYNTAVVLHVADHTVMVLPGQTTTQWLHSINIALSAGDAVAWHLRRSTNPILMKRYQSPVHMTLSLHTSFLPMVDTAWSHELD